MKQNESFENKIEKILDIENIDGVWIFHSFLLCNRENTHLVKNMREVRGVFLEELKSKKETFQHLSDELKKDFKRDIILSYVFIKNYIKEEY
ncbi:hypothetical protein [Poseidonibacter ostreae]|uniref:Uncharacterized protein n=1 Tax=Poseidonibacter ostreae TaxID=2654171 RepID=A0A6L4WX22_9BACT|nr:hypothetical protein [Poseidonibacter ostreae]KAB7891395.1 hypothetical protein GBG19_00735 [Poseidonibacter ostreae]